MDGLPAEAYTPSMESRSFRRRAVALIAAYAVALQALLATFVPIDSPALTAQLGVLCSHDDAGGTSHPGHELPCAAVCAALGHGIVGPLPPSVVVAYAKPLAIASPRIFKDWLPPRIAVGGPRASRGPPLA